MNSAKQSISLMVQDDYTAVETRHKLPSNHDLIISEYDEYVSHNGNGIVKKKVEEYLDWHSQLELEEKQQC